MFTVHFDVEITRRKRFHIITDPTGITVYRSRLVSDIIGWLLNEEQSVYMFVAECGTFRADLTPEVSFQE